MHAVSIVSWNTCICDVCLCVLGHGIKCTCDHGSYFKKSEICWICRPFRLHQGGWAGGRETGNSCKWGRWLAVTPTLNSWEGNCLTFEESYWSIIRKFPSPPLLAPCLTPTHVIAVSDVKRAGLTRARACFLHAHPTLKGPCSGLCRRVNSGWRWGIALMLRQILNEQDFCLLSKMVLFGSVETVTEIN